jgi:predicted membrane protein
VLAKRIQRRVCDGMQLRHTSLLGAYFVDVLLLYDNKRVGSAVQWRDFHALVPENWQGTDFVWRVACSLLHGVVHHCFRNRWPRVRLMVHHWLNGRCQGRALEHWSAQKHVALHLPHSPTGRCVHAWFDAVPAAVVVIPCFAKLSSL